MATALKLTLLLALTSILLQACGSVQMVKKSPQISTEQLLSAPASFAHQGQKMLLPEVDILKLDAAMKQFVKQAVPSKGSKRFRTQQLIAALLDRGLLNLDYDLGKTYTAIETFHTRAGNCLSFTNLFVALAREAGIEVKFQQVDVPPIWSQRDDFNILNNHINVKLETSLGANYEIDFNRVGIKGNFETWLISDESAFSQYYNNIGVRYLRQQDYVNAFRYLKKAIIIAPELSYNWTNLGAYYSQQKQYAYAEAAYLHAIKIDRRAKLATSNLAKLYKHLGDNEKAQYYQAKVINFRKTNPYYHYWLAKKAFEQQEYQDSIVSLKRAIKRKQDEHLFYFLLGSSYYQSGNKDKAKYFFKKAMQYSNSKTQGKYRSKIEHLMDLKS